MRKLLVLAFLLLPVIASAQELTRKIVLNTIAAKDSTSEAAALKFNSALKSKMVEMLGDRAQILDPDDIRSMPGKENFAAPDGAGADTVKALAAAVNAEEVVTGVLGREGDRVRIQLQTSSRDGAVKSSLNELFTDTELIDDATLGEIVKRLGNGKYVIKRTTGGAAKEIAGLKKFQPGTGVSERIQVLNFSTTDDTVAKLVNILQKDLDEGDAKFKDGDFTGAVSTYTGIIRKIAEKLTKEKQDKMKNYTDGVRGRIASSYAMVLKNSLQNLDDEIEKIRSNTESGFEAVNSRISELYRAFNGIPDEYRKQFAQFKDVIENRRDVAVSLSVQRLEERAGEFYRDLDFESALTKYEEAREKARTINDRNLQQKHLSAITKRIETTRISGKNYLSNRTKLMLDEVEELNLQDRVAEARKKARFAAEVIAGSKFKYDKLVEKYNAVADLLKINRISMSTRQADIADYAKKKKGVVKADGGLVLRTAPSKSAAKLATIPDGAEIAIIAITDRAESISGKSGNWLKVQFNNQTGYVFGGFVQQ